MEINKDQSQENKIEKLIDFINDYANAMYKSGFTVGKPDHEKWDEDKDICYNKLMNFIHQEML